MDEKELETLGKSLGELTDEEYAKVISHSGKTISVESPEEKPKEEEKPNSEEKPISIEDLDKEITELEKDIAELDKNGGQPNPESTPPIEHKVVITTQPQQQKEEPKVDFGKLLEN